MHYQHLIVFMYMWLILLVFYFYILKKPYLDPCMNFLFFFNVRISFNFPKREFKYF